MVYKQISERLVSFDCAPINQLQSGPIDETNRIRELMSVPTGENIDMKKITRIVFGFEDILPPESPEPEELDVLQIWADELGLDPEDIPEEPPVPAPADFAKYAEGRQS